jgi:hypothetical protein
MDAEPRLRAWGPADRDGHVHPIRRRGSIEKVPQPQGGHVAEHCFRAEAHQRGLLGGPVGIPGTAVSAGEPRDQVSLSDLVVELVRGHDG